MSTTRAHRWLSAFAALLLLASSAMPALVRMSCLSGGHVVLSLGQADDCCPEEGDHHTGSTVQAACCDVESAMPQRSEFQESAGQHTWLPVFTGHAAITTFLPVLVEQTDNDRIRSRPPPLRVSERLSQVRSFRI